MTKRILVVDDSADSCELMGLALSMSGHTVEMAWDGEQAVEKALQSHYDIALVDIGLPSMDGYEVAKEIRRRPGGASIVLIALTGYAQAADKRRRSTRASTSTSRSHSISMLSRRF